MLTCLSFAVEVVVAEQFSSRLGYSNKNRCSFQSHLKTATCLLKIQGTAQWIYCLLLEYVDYGISLTKKKRVKSLEGRTHCHTTDAMVNGKMLNDSERTRPEKQKGGTGRGRCSTNDCLTPTARWECSQCPHRGSYHWGIWKDKWENPHS